MHICYVSQVVDPYWARHDVSADEACLVCKTDSTIWLGVTSSKKEDNW